MAKILSVDDSKVMCDLVIAVLSDAGYQVITAENGKQALEIARKDSFDLILSDINMSEMDGITLVRKL